METKWQVDAQSCFSIAGPNSESFETRKVHMVYQTEDCELSYRNSRRLSPSQPYVLEFFPAVGGKYYFAVYFTESGLPYKVWFERTQEEEYRDGPFANDIRYISGAPLNLGSVVHSVVDGTTKPRDVHKLEVMNKGRYAFEVIVAAGRVKYTLASDNSISFANGTVTKISESRYQSADRQPPLGEMHTLFDVEVAPGTYYLEVKTDAPGSAYKLRVRTLPIELR